MHKIRGQHQILINLGSNNQTLSKDRIRIEALFKQKHTIFSIFQFYLYLISAYSKKRHSDYIKSMDYDLIDEQIQELRGKPFTENIKIINQNCFSITYSPQSTDSPYSHLVFNVKVIIPEKYPDVPPFLSFLDKIYHLNIDPVSGQVSMPILKDDWSPFLTLSAVFESLDNILQEPDADYAANQILKAEYRNEPEKYATKVSQMVNLCAAEVKENVNQSIVEHVEEIEQFKSEGLLLNNSFQKVEEQAPAKTLQHSLPFSQIQKEEKDLVGQSPPKERGHEIKIQTMSQRPSMVRDQSSRAILNNQKEPSPEKIAKPITISNSNDSLVGESFKQLKKSLSKKASEAPANKKQFDEIQLNLKKSDQLIELLLQGCQSMENTLNRSNNARIKQLLSSKLQLQWKMVEQLLQISSRLKEKLFNNIKLQTRNLLK